jgi:hypothetical protein
MCGVSPCSSNNNEGVVLGVGQAAVGCCLAQTTHVHCSPLVAAIQLSLLHLKFMVLWHSLFKSLQFLRL